MCWREGLFLSQERPTAGGIQTYQDREWCQENHWKVGFIFLSKKSKFIKGGEGWYTHLIYIIWKIKCIEPWSDIFKKNGIYLFKSLNIFFSLVNIELVNFKVLLGHPLSLKTWNTWKLYNILIVISRIVL